MTNTVPLCTITLTPHRNFSWEIYTVGDPFDAGSRYCPLWHTANSGIAEILQADLLVSSEAWRQLSSPHPERGYIFREHIELPYAKWKQIDFAPTDDSTLATFGGCYDVKR